MVYEYRFDYGHYHYSIWTPEKLTKTVLKNQGLTGYKELKIIEYKNN
jgi:hypothetical protein